LIRLWGCTFKIHFGCVPLLRLPVSHLLYMEKVFIKTRNMFTVVGSLAILSSKPFKFLDDLLSYLIDGSLLIMESFCQEGLLLADSSPCGVAINETI